MRIELDVDAIALKAFMKRYPQAMGESINVFKDRVGYKLDNAAKKAAPAITGNLRRQIFYYRNAAGEAKLWAYANYSQYVHGAPYYENKMKRKETPFFTRALTNSKGFIKDEARDIIKRVLK
jgi:hypothetical protein